jgi:hypothetical protein
MFFPGIFPCAVRRIRRTAHRLLFRGPRISAAFAAAIAAQSLVAAPAEPAPADLFAQSTPARPRGRLDELVFAGLAARGFEPAHGATDAVIVRRLYLDVIGTLPTAAEVRQFLQDQAPDKRRRLVERLLERPEYAEYWAMKWSDVLRVKAEFPVNLWPNAAQAYHRWILAAVRSNQPLDRFARELLTANGSNFRNGPVNFYRAVSSREPAGLAQAVALVFLGERTERWPAERTAGLAAFFSQVAYKGTGEWKEEIVYFDPAKAAAAAVAAARYPDGCPAALSPDRDARLDFAAWLTAPGNPYFARNLVNRYWGWLLGRGLADPVDDLGAHNPPVHPEVLAYLESEFTRAGCDAKALLRLILNSQTYQLAALPRSTDPEAERWFASYALRRLDAEVLIDAINRITGTTEKYSSAIPEPFTFVPEDQRSIALPDGSITSAFLEKFGRPGRDTGLAAERNNRLTAAQRLHLLNSTHIQRKLDQGPGLQAILRSRAGPRETVDQLYLTILSRLPAPEERRLVAAHAAAAPDARTAALDLAWALLNSAEFLHRH